MLLTVVADAQGKIVALGHMHEAGADKSGVARITVSPNDGHRAYLVTVPEALQNLELHDLAKSARLDLSGPQPILTIDTKRKK